MSTRSIRFRLVVWYAGVLTCVFLLLGALLYFSLERFLEYDLGESQTRRARQIADTLLAHVGQSGEARVASEVKDLYEPEVNDRFIRITRSDGAVVYVSGVPKDQSFDPGFVGTLPASPKKGHAQKVKLPRGKTLVVASVNYRTLEGSSYVVEVGSPLDSVETMLDRLFLELALVLPIAVLVAIGGGYLLVGRALAPVDQIAHKAAQITQHKLGERLPVARTADELERLSLSLNHMISRLEDAFLNSKRFVADASHELRTPLTAMRAELESMVSDARVTPEIREALGSVLEEVERLADIVEGLLAISRLDAGEAQKEWIEFDLGELATSTADQMNLLAEDKGITVSREVTPGIAVEGDPARLKQVVVNLLDNAIKYTPEKGRVRLRVAATNGHAVLEVSDNGMGIPADALPHVFDRFYRVDKARTREPGGAGLGLSIVKSICTAHGGVVEAASSELGSQFLVKLPLAQSHNGR